MVDSTYGWNIISDGGAVQKLMDKLKLCMFATELRQNWVFQKKIQQHDTIGENLGGGGARSVT